MMFNVHDVHDVHDVHASIGRTPYRAVDRQYFDRHGIACWNERL